MSIFTMKVFAVSAILLSGLIGATPTPQAGSASCKAYTVLFARGTTESGTLGSVVGPGLQKSVLSALGTDKVTFTASSHGDPAQGIYSHPVGHYLPCRLCWYQSRVLRLGPGLSRHDKCCQVSSEQLSLNQAGLDWLQPRRYGGT